MSFTLMQIMCNSIPFKIIQFLQLVGVYEIWNASSTQVDLCFIALNDFYISGE